MYAGQPLLYLVLTPMTTATHINYLHLCHRKLWLHHREMRMEDNSTAVHLGKLVEEGCYRRRASRWQEVSLGRVKIDHYDPRLRLVREVKKSPKLEYVHIAQVQYYLYVLELTGVPEPSGVIEYPKQRRRTEVPILTDEDRARVRQWEVEVNRIVDLVECPPMREKVYCKTCAFRDFCMI